MDDSVETNTGEGEAGGLDAPRNACRNSGGGKKVEGAMESIMKKTISAA